MNIGDNISSLMKARKITQIQLANKAHISQSTLSAIINGTTPKESTLYAICEALGVTMDKISEETTQEIKTCPRCGSNAIIEWNNHGNGKCRIKCAYCEADTNEQKSRAHAIHVFNSFGRKAERSEKSDTYILSLAELLDSACADADDVRPVWFENRGLFIVPSLIQYGTAERELEIVKVLWWGNMAPKTYLLDLYNKTWRCWNRRPTAERSDASAWSDE